MKQFQSDYFYLGCQKDIKLMILRMLVNGNGVRVLMHGKLLRRFCLMTDTL